VFHSLPVSLTGMQLIAWSGFVALVLALLALDLGVFNRKVHEPTVAEALGWSAFWIALAMAFNGLVYFLYENNWIGVGLTFPVDIDGRQASLEFFTGYLLEKSLSLDNIFVIALIFSYFRIPLRYQHRVLFWGVLGALVMRGVMIGAGAALMSRFAWMTYAFGALLLLTAGRMLTATHENLDPERSILVRAARRFYPVTDGLREQHFFVVERGVRSMTPLLLVLLMVEGTDVLFAVDSIPAIFAVTDDPFLVYTSNVFAILGLRSLYFVLAPLLGRIRFLRVSLVVVLAFVGVKMILAHHHPIPVIASLTAIVSILALGFVASAVFPEPAEAGLRSPVEGELDRLFRLTWSIAVRSVALMLGGTLIAVGVFLLLIPGLGLKAILAGLTLMAPQFVWARSLLTQARHRMEARKSPGEERGGRSGG
jgi:tellurite resistance protein TerC